MNKLILILLAILTGYTANAGNDVPIPVRRNHLILQTGFDQSQDLNLHPKVFRGLMLGAAFAHQKTDVRISFFEAGIKTSLLNTEYEAFPSAISLRLQGHFGYLFPVYSNARIDLYVGSLSDLQFGTSIYFNWDESHLYYANYISEGPGARLILRNERFHLAFDLDFPLLSVISRPEKDRQYKIDDLSFGGIMQNLASNPELVLPNRHFYFRSAAKLVYRNKEAKERSWGFLFRYHFMQSDSGEPFRSMEQLVTYKIYF